VSTWKPILAALVIFGAGVVTGGLTVQLRGPRPVPPRADPGDPGRRPAFGQRSELQLREIARRMENQLDLTRDQRERVMSIVRDTQNRMRGILDEVAPRTREEFRQMREKIRAELAPEQRRRFEEIFRARREDGERLRNRAPADDSPTRQKAEQP
jgi:hypothetical protein